MDYQVQKSITIKASIQEVYNSLYPLKKWEKWSPWFFLQKDAQFDYNGESQVWNGKYIGAGSMKITSKTENESIYIDLNFTAPMRSKASTNFRLVEKKGNTEVIWTMDGSVPFLFFPIISTIKMYVSMDYERGLKMLKYICEEGPVHSELEPKGITSFPSQEYIGIRHKIPVSELGTLMPADFGRLMTLQQDKKIEITDKPFSIYHKYDLVNLTVDYTAAVPVSLNRDQKTKLETSGDYEFGTIEITKAYQLDHQGPYDFVGNAWISLIMRIRGDKHKIKKSISGIERYLNSPYETEPNKLQTEIYIPIK